MSKSPVGKSKMKLNTGYACIFMCVFISTVKYSSAASSDIDLYDLSNDDVNNYIERIYDDYHGNRTEISRILVSKGMRCFRGKDSDYSHQYGLFCSLALCSKSNNDEWKVITFKIAEYSRKIKLKNGFVTTYDSSCSHVKRANSGISRSYKLDGMKEINIK